MRRVLLAAQAGYQFVDWTGDVDTAADINASSIAITFCQEVTQRVELERTID